MKMTNSLKLLLFFVSLGFFACSKDDGGGENNGGGNNGGGDNNQAITSITLSVNAETITVNEDFMFTVQGNEGTDVTENSTIYINGTEMNGITFTPNTVGSYEAYAEYVVDGDTLSSNTLSLEVAPEAPDTFTQRVLIEDFTGTWCGWCPRVQHALELVKQQTDKAVVVGIHRGDEFNYNANALESQINLQGYPTAMLNRSTLWQSPEPSNITQVTSLTGTDATIGIKINASESGGNLDVTVDVKFSEDYSSQDLRLVVYVVENGLVGDQENYTSYYNGVPVIQDFVHDHVLRASFTGADLLGEAIPADNTSAGEVYSVNFNEAVPQNVVETSNIDIVAFVLSANDYALNARNAHLGETQEFVTN